MRARTVSVVIKIAFQFVRRQQVDQVRLKEEGFGLFGKERSRRKVDNISESKPAADALTRLQILHGFCCGGGGQSVLNQEAEKVFVGHHLPLICTLIEFV